MGRLHLGHADFELGGRGLENFRAWQESQGNVYLHVVSTFHRSSAPPGSGKDLCCASYGPPCPCRVPVRFMSHFDGVEGFIISRPCSPLRNLCNHPLLSRTLKAPRAMEPEHDNMGYVFLFASSSQSGCYVLNSWTSSGPAGTIAGMRRSRTESRSTPPKQSPMLKRTSKKRGNAKFRCTIRR